MEVEIKNEDVLKFEKDFKKESGLDIKYQELSSDFFVMAMFEYLPSKSYITIYLKKEFEEIAGILHELMHAKSYLINEFGVIGFPSSKRIPGTEFYELIEMIGSYTDDQIINKDIFSLEYNPISKIYFTNLEKDTKRMKKGDPHIMDRLNQISIKTGVFFRAFRYILAESILEFSNWKQKKLINEFLSFFKSIFKDSLEISEKIKEIYRKYDIFKKSEHDITLKELIDLVGLNDPNVKVFTWVKNHVGDGYILK